MALKLFNTLSRTILDFERSDPNGPVRLYTCGPTVYNYLHIGNYRTYIFEDVLKRTLKLFGHPVRHVMNITDVGHLTSQADEGEDKMAVAAAREGKTAWDVAKFYTQTFLADSKKLRFDFDPAKSPKRGFASEAADILCNATDHIEEQAAVVRMLIVKGLTYETSDGIYFNTEGFHSESGDYGCLAGKAHTAGLQEGARVAMGEKRRATDFALWKFSAPGEGRQMEWEHSWFGKPARMGFPGWHIECSAMAETYLGKTLDIHCGGVDHIPIHHTNEIAQAEAANGVLFSRFWMHGEFLVVNQGKMSKSDGTFITLDDLEKRGFDPLDFRYFCYSAHYRKQLDFSWEALEAAKTARARLRERAAKLRPPAVSERIDEAWKEAFDSALGDDLNVPKALAVLYSGLDDEQQHARFTHADKVLALGLFDEKKQETLSPELQVAFEQYAAARKAKDFKSSDSLRQKLFEAGIVVKDTKEGSTWSRR